MVKNLYDIYNFSCKKQQAHFWDKIKDYSVINNATIDFMDGMRHGYLKTFRMDSSYSDNILISLFDDEVGLEEFLKGEKAFLMWFARDYRLRHNKQVEKSMEKKK